MPWNEPGNNKDQDPWNRKKKNAGPPDLDDLFKSIWKKIAGNNKGGASTGNSGGGIGLSVILLIFAVVWIFLGLYTVKEQEQALILRFGAYERTETSGLHWVPRGIESKVIVDIEKIRTHQIQAEMLTQGASIVLVDFGVQYRVDDPEAYVFNLTDSDETVRAVAESALRQVIGDSSLDDILTEGKGLIRTRTSDIMQQILTDYKAGIKITNVTVGDSRAPAAVKAAFDDVTSAKADREKFIKEAESYTNKEVPLAEGNAEKYKQAALAYSQKVVADAQGRVALFEKLLPEYEAAPEVTRRRLYLETMEQVLGKIDKVLVDESNQQVNLLSLDGILNKNRASEKGDR